jgi:maltose alpha-D-glucosyltransferase / alpha-amylase
VLLIEVNYKSGLPDTYLLPVTFAKKKFADSVLQEFPQAVVTKLTWNGQEGILCDAYYTPSMQSWLFENIAKGETLSLDNSAISFAGAGEIKKYFFSHEEIRPRVHLTRFQDNSAIGYDNSFFLKLYRKVDGGVNPDHEMSQYLSQEAKFPYTPKYRGSIQWKFKKATYVLAMMQDLIENHGDGYSYMLERVNNFIERILARKDFLDNIERKGNAVHPVRFEALPTELQDLLGARASDESALFGVRTGQLHLALCPAKAIKDFAPENFSLHYQRSLFSSALALVRETYHILQQKKASIPEREKPAVQQLLGRKNEMIAVFKKIYSRKFDVVKTRTHGTLGLGQILLTGRDVAIHDFGGVPYRSYSETRIKRSPLIDVASMMRSFYYAGYEGFLSTSHVQQEEINHLLSYADIWTHYMNGFFLKAYVDTVKQTNLIPKAKDELQIMLQYYLLEKALTALKYELLNRPERLIVPLAMIRDVLG